MTSTPPRTVAQFKRAVLRGFRAQYADASLVWERAQVVTFPTGLSGFFGEGLVRSGSTVQHFHATADDKTLTVFPN